MKVFAFDIKVETRGVALRATADAYGTDPADAERNLRDALTNSLKVEHVEETVIEATPPSSNWHIKESSNHRGGKGRAGHRQVNPRCAECDLYMEWPRECHGCHGRFCGACWETHECTARMTPDPEDDQEERLAQRVVELQKLVDLFRDTINGQAEQISTLLARADPWRIYQGRCGHLWQLVIPTKLGQFNQEHFNCPTCTAQVEARDAQHELAILKQKMGGSLV